MIMENSNINIDTEKLQAQIEALKKESEKMSKLIDEIKQNGNSLPQIWETKTSEGVMKDLNTIYKSFDDINKTNQSYIAFLEKVVSGQYTNKEQNINKLIDEKI